MEEGNICLSSTTYGNHLTDTFKKLFSSHSYADVTLVSDDNQQMKAHKFILSACSPILDAMLTTNPHPHTLLYMRGIKLLELQAIVEFMYLGMTYVSKNRLVEFMKIAKDLGIKELTPGDEDETKATNIHPPQEEPSIDTANQEVHPVKDENMEKSFASEAKCGECDKVFSNQAGLKFHIKAIHNGLQFYCEKCEYGTSTSQKLKRHQADKHGDRYFCNQCEKKDTGNEAETFCCNQCDFHAFVRPELADHKRTIHKKLPFQCSRCEFQTTVKQALFNHKVDEHQEVLFSCQQCDHKASSAPNLKSHKLNVHDGLRYACDQCDYQATQVSSLKQHVRSKHDGIEYSCNSCEYKTVWPKALKEHQRRFHIVGQFVEA